MNRPAKTVLTALTFVLLTSMVSYLGSLWFCARHVAGADDLSWVRREFHLSGVQLARVQQLHNDYLAECRTMRDQIADKDREVSFLVANGNIPFSTMSPRIVELATLRGECRARMLVHFEEVSRAMSPEQGKRYLAEMKWWTFCLREKIDCDPGLDHESHG